MENSSSFYVCGFCRHNIPTINRLLHNARCSSFHSDFAPAPASEVRDRPNVNLPPAGFSQPVFRSIPVPSAPASSSSLPFWECQQCTFHNTNIDDFQCEMCGISKSIAGGGFQTIEREQEAQRGANHNIDDSSQSWECRTCTCLNDMHLDHCQACDHPRPPRASTTERLVPDLFVEAEPAYPQHFVDAEPLERDMFFDSTRRSSSQRSASSAVAAPPSAATSALYGAAGGAAFAWMRGESITRGAITGAGVGLTTGVLLNELSELNRHAERMNHAAVGIDRHGGVWDRERDAERNARLLMEMQTLLEALPIEMLQGMASGQQRGINDEQLAELPNHTFSTTTTTQQSTPGSSGSSSCRNCAAQPQECAVCLQAYSSGEQIRTLPCFHQFHSQCVDQWLRVNAKCPICKTSVTHS